MSLTSRRRRLAAVALGLVAVLGAGTACGGSDSGGSGGKVTLTVNLFGQFGYEDLYKQYEKSHPNVKIIERGTGAQLGDYTTKLTQWLAAGKGAGDVVALEEGIITQFKAQPQNFVDLNRYGGSSLSGNFLDWKWKQGQTADGKQLIGLGTDVGSMAMCYRKDLFGKAGLPTERDAVSALWPSWDAYITTGEKFTAAKTGAKFLDAGSNTYNTILMQTAGAGPGYTYFDNSGTLVINDNAAVKQAYDLTLKMIDKGLSAGYKAFSDQWTAAFKQGKFATIACPAWMLGVIEGNAGPANANKWDVAAVPGGGGNWGGSFLSVPKQSKHPKEAAELVKFLTSPQGQIAAFKAKNTLPSSPQALGDPAVKDATNVYFSNAPVGQVFAQGASALKPVFLGPKNQAVRDAVENTLLAVQQGQLDAGKAWDKAAKDGEQAAS